MATPPSKISYVRVTSFVAGPLGEPRERLLSSDPRAAWLEPALVLLDLTRLLER
jgi:hypothetical protein